MKYVVTMTIDDVDHYTEEERRQIIADYPEHEREARAQGIPQLGSGRIFPVTESKVKCERFEVPKHWWIINGIDFGWDHPTACAQLVWDKDNDVFYVTKISKFQQTPVAEIANRVRHWGQIPWAWPHDGLQHDKGAGEQLYITYENEGINMLPERSTFEDGGNSVEAGVLELLDLMRTDRFKVFEDLEDFFDEFRTYHRKEGKIVKLHDDAICAIRYAYMMRRFAVPVGYRNEQYNGTGELNYPDLDIV